MPDGNGFNETQSVILRMQTAPENSRSQLTISKMKTLLENMKRGHEEIAASVDQLTTISEEVGRLSSHHPHDERSFAKIIASLHFLSERLHQEYGGVHATNQHDVTRTQTAAKQVTDFQNNVELRDVERTSFSRVIREIAECSRYQTREHGPKLYELSKRLERIAIAASKRDDTHDFGDLIAQFAEEMKTQKNKLDNRWHILAEKFWDFETAMRNGNA